MPFTKNKLLLTAAILCFGATAALAELTVLKRSSSLAKAYRVGARLPDNHRFNLRADDTILLLRSGGGQILIRGPGRGTAEMLARSSPPQHRNTERAGN